MEKTYSELIKDGGLVYGDMNNPIMILMPDGSIWYPKLKGNSWIIKGKNLIFVKEKGRF